MTNFEKYKEEIKAVIDCGSFKLSPEGKIEQCPEESAGCNDCQFYDSLYECQQKLMEWGMKEYVPLKEVLDRMNVSDVKTLTILGSGSLSIFWAGRAIFYNRPDDESFLLPDSWDVFKGVLSWVKERKVDIEINIEDALEVSRG